jgi:hypothetical protein
MDTRFWGPSGWKLLHLITFDYTYSSANAVIYANFLETVPYILPCKFCRSSLTDYYREHPYSLSNSMMDPTVDLKKWMYMIHNRVNDKLRSQGIHSNVNPSYKSIHKLYTQIQDCSIEKQLSYIWNFLFSIGYNHPKDKSRNDEPMPDCPASAYKCKNMYEKNKWNILPFKQRMLWYKRFWHCLPAVLPLKIRDKWIAIEKRNPCTLFNREAVLSWLWRMRCGLDTHYKDPYTTVCKVIKSHSITCNNTHNIHNTHNNTCRAPRQKNKKKYTLKNK